MCLLFLSSTSCLTSHCPSRPPRLLLLWAFPGPPPLPQPPSPHCPRRTQSSQPTASTAWAQFDGAIRKSTTCQSLQVRSVGSACSSTLWGFENNTCHFVSSYRSQSEQRVLYERRGQAAVHVRLTNKTGKDWMRCLHPAVHCSRQDTFKWQDPEQSHVLAFSWIRHFSGCHQIHFTQQWGWTCFKMTSQLSPDRSNLGSQELIWAVHNCQPVICLRNVFARPSFTPTKTDVFKCAVLNWKRSTLLSTLGLFCLRGGHTGPPACSPSIINHFVK